MKRIIAILMICCLFVMTGCKENIGKMFNPGDNNAELYYNTYPDIRNQIKRENVKREDHYNDLFLTDGIKSGMTLAEVLYGESREALLDISTPETVFFMPTATGGTRLTEWINQATIRYTFNNDDTVKTYEILNSKKNNTYIEYLYVMRALGLKYGECTTEIYKNEDNIIDNSKIKEDYKDVEEIVNFFDSEFANGNVEIISQWINDGFIITVNFSAGKECSVIYQFADFNDSEVDA